jgi:pectinesterase
VVSQTGDGDYKTIQEAFDKIPNKSKKGVIVFVKNGVYKEKVVLDSLKNKVTLIGEDQFKTIITFDDYSGKTDPKGVKLRTGTSYSFLIKADDFKAENITFKNEAGFNAGQAVVLDIKGNRAIIKNCRLIGDQDVLYFSTPNKNSYLENCYIEGTTDFIFGFSTAWFQNCHIHSKKDSYITAASTPQDTQYGFVFNNCILTADSSVSDVYLGRPWRPYAATIFMRSYLGSHIKAEGWSVWNKLDTYALSRYAEYENYGPGAKKEQRVSWSKQLTEQEALNYNLKQVLNGWKPKANAK